LYKTFRPIPVAPVLNFVIYRKNFSLVNMLFNGESDEEQTRTHLMFIEENRVKSFKDWVFDSCMCTPKKVPITERPKCRKQALYLWLMNS